MLGRVAVLDGQMGEARIAFAFGAVDDTFDNEDWSR